MTPRVYRSWRWLQRVLLVGLCALLAASAPVTAPRDVTVASSVRKVADAITELDVERAQALLETVDEGGASVAYQRARLAVYVGDCDSAEAILATLPESNEVMQLAELARTCSRATAGALVVEDKQAGVWVRLQDAADAALVPLLVEVSVRSREAMVRDLGIELPRPLRIDLVRDLFSLAGVSGLPVEAAETTGTVAVARWGRVTMLSPRAARFGYPWQDTLAHEITHLALTRGSRDFAPLWLQEGIAKREETRWRAARPFDDATDPHHIAKRALLEGESVGIDQIGPSIALLPTPRAAAIAYAEVESFMDFWIEQQGREAFALLMADMKGMRTREVDLVMTSVSGYPLRYWIEAWKRHLLSQPEPEAEAEPLASAGGAVRQVRLGDLCWRRGHCSVADGYFEQAVQAGGDKPAVRQRAALTALALEQNELAEARLGNLQQVSNLHGGWLGIQGRLLKERGQSEPAEAAFDLGVAIDPFGQVAACEGYNQLANAEVMRSEQPRQWLTHNVTDPTRRKLCESARSLVHD